jgi:predicted sulfurtransferase
MHFIRQTMISNNAVIEKRCEDAMKKILYASVMLFLFLSWAAQARAESQTSAHSWDKVVAEAKKGGYHLISPEELKNEYLKDPSAFLLVDTRQEWSYQMQHIKGAAHIDFAPTWWNQYSPMMRSEMKNLLGPDKNKKIVFY